MTNEELLSVAEIVERATNRFNAQAAYHRERFDEHVKLIASMKADHEAKMVEHRAAFGARTEADAKIIAGLRSEIGAARMAVLERDSLISERDGLLTQVQDMRVEIERMRIEAWGFRYCEPCDPPATHDTEAGKAAAAKARPEGSACTCHNNPPCSHCTWYADRGLDDPESDEIEMCVGDEIEVIGRSDPTPTSGLFTGTIAQIGTRGIAKMIHGTAGFVELDNGTRASIKDVRKVTT